MADLRLVEGNEITASKRLIERSVETFAESRQSRAKSIERTEAPGPSRQRQRSGETSRQLRGKSAERTVAIPTPSKRQSRGKSAERTDAISTPSKRQSRGPSIQPRGPSIDSRRSTSSARFGSATRFVDDDSDSSRPSSKNSINSSLPDGYEEINKNNKRAINGILYIIHEINGKKYYRRYKPCGSMGNQSKGYSCQNNGKK
uniref:Uncharacterized protein n=1 Tax=Panagrolaimus davidi TaxID=227884 RepID=A0A914PHY5_9BILA